MDRGLLEFRKVGTHHRVRVSSVRPFSTGIVSGAGGVG
jgi:hypothetical protein